MKIKKVLFPALIASLLTGCGWMGHYSPPNELGQVSRTNAGLCFAIKNAGDYYVHYLAIRDSGAPERSDFNRMLPALKIENNQLCIPATYYRFPNSGARRVDIALRSPTKKRIRRFIVSEFTMVKGEPHPFSPDEYSIPLPDLEE